MLGGDSRWESTWLSIVLITVMLLLVGAVAIYNLTGARSGTARPSRSRRRGEQR